MSGFLGNRLERAELLTPVGTPAALAELRAADGPLEVERIDGCDYLVRAIVVSVSDRGSTRLPALTLKDGRPFVLEDWQREVLRRFYGYVWTGL
jgi:hypothetical protein